MTKKQFIILYSITIFIGSCDPSIKFGTISNESKRRLVVEFDTSHIVTDRKLFIGSDQFLIGPGEVGNCSLFGIANHPADFIWYFSCYDADTLKKYFFNRPMPDPFARVIGDKAFLGKILVTQDRFLRKNIHIVYQKDGSFKLEDSSVK
jgi:hypothetical protein